MSRLVLLAFLLLAACQSKAPAVAASSPVWHVHSALSLFMGNGDMRSLLDGKSGPSPLITRLQSGRTLLPLDTLDPAHLKAAQHVFLLQPSALPPEELVAFDAWVRAGGRAVILADPDMVWPVENALDPKSTPPPSTLLDGLFKHWGLALEGVRTEPRVRTTSVGGLRISVVNSGQWSANAVSAPCTLSDDALLADCRIGKGRALLFADADVADPRLWAETGQDNLPAIAALFKRLES